MKITIMTPREFELSDSLVQFIRETVSHSGKVPAIKYLRASLDLDLRTAKDLADKIVELAPSGQLSPGQMLRDKLR